VNITNVHNVYNTTVINNTTVNRVSYNGGNGGINTRPRPEEETAARERHIAPVAIQTQHVQAARANPELRASANHGKPPVAATPKPGAFNDRAVVPAKEAGAPYNPPANRAVAAPSPNAPAAHPENNAARPDRVELNRPPTAQPNNQPDRPSAAQPNNRPVPNRNEPAQPTAQQNSQPDRQPAAQPNNRPESIRPATPQPNNRPESKSPPTAQPNSRPEPNRSESVQQSQTPPPIERSQPQRTPPETPRAVQEQPHPQPAAQMPGEKKPQGEQPKKDEKPPQ